MSVLLADGKPRPLTKNEKRRLKEKQKAPVIAASSSEPSSSSALAGLDVEIEYVSASSLAASEGVVDAAALAEFQAVFQKFAKPEELLISSSSSAAAAAKKEQEEAEGNGGQESTGEGSGGGDDANGKLSKKKLKLLNRVSVAELKQAVQRPDVIEAHDVTSSDPHLLVYLKAYRNSVLVPRHWSSKSKYLQRKRGTEKPPFKVRARLRRTISPFLPSFSPLTALTLSTAARIYRRHGHRQDSRLTTRGRGARAQQVSSAGPRAAQDGKD
jgi:splicing factor 3B subunit 2